MKRSVGVLCSLQAAIYVALAVFLGARWAPLYAVLGAAALLQAAAGVVVLLRRPAEAWVRSAAIGSLLAVGLVLGLYVQIGAHAVRHFAAVGAGMGWAVIGGALAATPWLLFFPIWQLARVGLGRRGGVGLGAGLLVLASLPALLQLHGPSVRYGAHDGAAAAAWLLERWEGTAGALPASEGPALLLVSVVKGGAIEDRQVLEGADLASALQAWQPPPRRDGAALVVDLALDERPLSTPWLATRGVALLPAGEGALRGPEGVRGGLELWRSKSLRRAVIAPGVRVDALDLGKGPAKGATHSLLTSAWLAGEQGVVPMQASWAAPPELSADAVLEAAIEGARMVARNMDDEGRFAYLVKGPSGELGKGYNYPRHAGTTWYLARAAARSGDPALGEAARRALDHLGERSFAVGDGRQYILDPQRDDGKSWVGTTSLALLAALELGAREDLQRAWSAQVISAVDQDGIVWANYHIEDDAWMTVNRISYAQGQGTLAVAAAARAGLPGSREALERIAAGWESTYWPMPAGRLFAGGEHWSCSAALVASEVLERPVGWGLCEGYLHRDAFSVPQPGPVQPIAGAAGGGAEAVIARAEQDRRDGLRGLWYDRALAYGRLFLASAYRPADSPLLGRPSRLIGGFRDSPVRLDVQVDAVQHIGCALLGVERLLRDAELPGGSP